MAITAVTKDACVYLNIFKLSCENGVCRIINQFSGGLIDGQHSVTTKRGPVTVMEISCEYFSPSIFFTDHHASQISQFAWNKAFTLW